MPKSGNTSTRRLARNRSKIREFRASTALLAKRSSDPTILSPLISIRVAYADTFVCASSSGQFLEGSPGRRLEVRKDRDAPPGKRLVEGPSNLSLRRTVFFAEHDGKESSEPAITLNIGVKLVDHSSDAIFKARIIPGQSRDGHRQRKTQRPCQDGTHLHHHHDSVFPPRNQNEIKLCTGYC